MAVLVAVDVALGVGDDMLAAVPGGALVAVYPGPEPEPDAGVSTRRPIIVRALEEDIGLLVSIGIKSTSGL